MDKAWEKILEQGPLFAFMAIVIYFGAKYLKSERDKDIKREDAREARYNALVDKLIIVFPEQTAAVTKALTAATEVMERVERRLKDV